MNHNSLVISNCKERRGSRHVKAFTVSNEANTNTCHDVVVFLVLLNHAVTRAVKSIAIETEKHRRNSKSLVMLVCRDRM